MQSYKLFGAEAGAARLGKHSRRTVVPVLRSTRGLRRRSARGWPPTVLSGPVVAAERRPDLAVPVLAASRHDTAAELDARHVGGIPLLLCRLLTDWRVRSWTTHTRRHGRIAVT
ncbi:hypothetical protein M6B38_409680 [Iris pallida]|uniref:Uncharacterized protein n=1 Tax=Iris pallida TaxID=29817 RepID=A0AAX6FNH8_IRIPA|nr:hypothetical protein M6B38_409680 [Iris pallida]